MGKLIRFRLRKVRKSDSGRLLHWRNDPVTRRNSFSARPVRRSEHEAWLASSLSNPSRTLLLAVRESGGAIGVLRYDRRASLAEVHLNVAPRERGKGWGVRLLIRGQVWLCTRTPVKKVIAKIKPQNKASIRAFEAAGFRRIRRGREYDTYGCPRVPGNRA